MIARLGDKRVKSSYGTIELPNEYQEVEYIHTSGTEYIDTLETFKATTNFKLTIALDSTSGDKKFFGTYTSSAGMVLGIISNCWRIGIPFTTLYSIPATTNKTVIEYNNGTWSFNGITTTLALTTHFIGDTIPLGVVSYYGSILEGTSIAIYGLELYNGTTLVKKFVPCYRKADNIIGMYDTVSQTFFTNAGTGTFTKGSDVTSQTSTQVLSLYIKEN